MEKDILIKNISVCLASNDPQIELNNFVRNYFINKVNTSEIKDGYLKEILFSLVKHFVIILEPEKERHQNNPPHIKDNKQFLLFSVAGIAGITTIFSDSTLLRIVASGVLATASILGTKIMYKVKNDIPSTLPPKIKTSPDDVYAEFVQYESVFEKLICFNSLESYDKGIIAWMQQQYSESDDNTFRNSIRVILKQSGYEFVNYSKDIAAYFDSNTANVKEVVTTYPAVRSNHSGHIIQRGHVIFPNKV